MANDTRLGTTIGGYRIDSLIGRGGMGTVYLAEHAGLQRKVALKVLSAELADDPKFRERFVRESRVAASIEDPNIVPIYEAGEADGVLFIAMRYVRGTDVKALIAHEGAFSPRRAVSIISQVASALDAAHAEGLIHRDIKPANILLVPAPDTSRPDKVYLSDFGLTKRASSDSGLTSTGQFVGTLDYAAPEQIEGNPLSPQTDVYSLGCVLYECLTARVPYQRDQDVARMHAHLMDPPPRVTDIRPELPSRIDAVVARAMAKKPEDRHINASHLADAARVALSSGNVAHEETTSRPRTRISALVVAAAVLLAAVVVGVLLLTRSRLPTTNPSASGANNAGAPPPNSVVEISATTERIVHLTRGVIVSHTKQWIAAGEGSVWIAASGSSIQRIDDRTGVRLAPIATPNYVETVAVGIRTVWFDAPGPRPGTTNLARLDPADGRLLPSIPLALPGVLTGIAPSDTYKAVWVTAGHDVVRVDALTNKMVRTNTRGTFDGVAVGEGAVWALDDTDGQVIRIDPRTNRVMKRIPISGNLSEIAVGAGGVWVLDNGAGNVIRIDPQTDQAGSPIRVGNDPTGIATGLGAVWVTDNTDGNLYRIDPRTYQASPIRIGSPMSGVAVDQQERTVWALVG